RFREDLFYRLAVVPITMPSLADRRADIEPLATEFLSQLATTRGIPTPTLTEDALATLQGHDWPGNVRQLRNIMERVLILAPVGSLKRIESANLPPDILQSPTEMVRGDPDKSIMGSPLREAREAFEREYLRIQIRRFSGNISRTATFIGMERSALHRKLKALRLGDAAEEERKD
ncbi:MAG: helix-turn-helix domain-containing protein, partial [Pseudomonadota bacterium]